MKYQIKYGKFGAYFYDDEEARELTLWDVLALLNQQEDKKEREEDE